MPDTNIIENSTSKDYPNDVTYWQVLITKIDKVDGWSDEIFQCFDISIEWEAITGV